MCRDFTLTVNNGWRYNHLHRCLKNGQVCTMGTENTRCDVLVGFVKVKQRGAFMRDLNKKQYVFAMAITLLLISGCGNNKNFFAPMHSDGIETNSSVLVADGKAALERGDYVNAEKYFGLAKENNPKNSEALLGYAQAYLKSRGFSLGQLVTRILNSMEDVGDSSASSFELVNPADWNQGSVAELATLFQTIITTLEPIALGQTEGPITSDNVDVNATSGLFYLLSFALDIESLSTDYVLTVLDPDDPEVQALIDPAILATLPDDGFFWYVYDTGSGLTQPPASFIDSIESKLTVGLARLNKAAANTSSEDVIKQFTSIFEEWETLASQL